MSIRLNFCRCIPLELLQSWISNYIWNNWFKMKSPIFWFSHFINYLSSVNWVVIHKVASHFSTPSNKLTTSHSGTDICSTSDNGHQLGKFIKQVTFCKPLKYTARKFIMFLSCPAKNSRDDLVTNEPMDHWNNWPMDQWTNGQIDQWINGPEDQWTNGSMDQWTNGRMDPWTNKPTNQ